MSLVLHEAWSGLGAKFHPRLQGGCIIAVQKMVVKCDNSGN